MLYRYIYRTKVGPWISVISSFQFVCGTRHAIIDASATICASQTALLAWENLNQCIMLILYRFNHKSNQSRIMMKEFRYNATQL